MKLDSLEKLYVHELKDLYSAEKQLIEALQMLQSTAIDDELKQAFQDHLEETENHLARLDEIFSSLNVKPGGQKCHGMEGLIKESKKLMQEDMEDNVIDAALVAAAQRCEHYEIAGYGTARAYAEKLGRKQDADLLQETLNEEGQCNENLTRLAEQRLNLMAQES